MTKKEQKYINSLKEENERVKNMLLRFVDAIGKLKNIDDIVNVSLIPLMTEENQKIRAEIKAEAYKECIDKANGIITEIYNKHIFGSNNLNDEEKDAIINFSDDVSYKLRDLVKMVGE